MTGILPDRIRPWIVRASIVSIAATLFAILYGARVTTPRTTGVDSYSAGPLGHKALLDVLERLGTHVERVRHGRYAGATAPVLFLEPTDVEARVEGHMIRLRNIVDARGAAGHSTVVVLPKWDPAPAARSDGAIPAEERAQKVLGALFDGTQTLAHEGTPTETPILRPLSGAFGTVRVEVPWLQLVKPELFELSDKSIDAPLRAGAGAVVIEDPARGLFVVTDPDIGHNFNFHRADHTQIWGEVLRAAGAADTVLVDEVFHGHGLRLALGDALGQFPNVLVVLHAVLLSVLLALAGARPFGPPKPPPPGLDRGPREVIAVAAGVLATGEKPASLAAAYIEHILDDLASTLGIDARERDRASRLDALARNRGIAPLAGTLERTILRLRTQRPPRPREVLRITTEAHAFWRRMVALSQLKKTE